MGDLLSAASLILAVVGMLYSLWYPEIQKALDEQIPKFKEDRIKINKAIGGVLWTRSLPLAILALIVSLIFTPDTLKVSYEIYNQISTSDIATFFRNYDSVGIAFCVVEILTIGIGLHVLVMSIKLIKLRYFHK